MWTLTLRSLRAHRSRLLLATVAVAAAVGFVTASFVLADSLRAVFGGISSNIYENVDGAILASEGDFDALTTGDRFDESAIAEVATINGIDTFVPGIGGENVVFTVDADGEHLRPEGPPTLVFSRTGDGLASPLTTVSGHAPGDGEIMLDTAQARRLGVGIGDPVTVATTDGDETYTLSGTVVFGGEESGVDPYFLLFDMDTTQHLLDAPGQIDSAALFLDEGTTLDDVSSDISAALPPGLALVDNAQLIADQNAAFGQVIDLFGNALLVFAGITLFVSIFVIANTFAVVVGQQRQEMGLLRAVGARPGQAAAVVLGEAALVGIVASAIGIALGIGIAEGIKLLFESVTEGGFPEGPTQLLSRTVIVSVLLGVGVTVAAAALPARRAGKVSPLAAMSPHTEGNQLTAGQGAHWLYRGLVTTIGKIGPSGQIAATGIARSPRRVLTTSMSMIVGLAVITTIAVLGSSYRTTLETTTTTGLNADEIITGDDGVAVPYHTIDELAGLPEVEAVSGYGSTEVRHDGSVINLASYQSNTASGVVALDSIEGSVGPLRASEVVVDNEFARTHDLSVGDVVSVEFSDGYQPDLTITAVIDQSPLIDGPLLVDASLVMSHARNVDAGFAALRFADGVDADQGRRAVAAALADQPQFLVQPVAAYVAGQQAQVDQILTLANGLLGLTVIIALIGIANTIGLSLIERRTELGLLRAVGMSRRQIGRMIRWEALALAVIGSLAGVVLGIILAAATAAFVPDSFIIALQVPLGSLAIYAALCVGCAVVAASIPARRAARLKILDAIAIPS